MWIPKQNNTKPRMKNYSKKFNLGTWNMRSLYMTYTPMVVQSNLENYGIALTAVLEVRRTREVNVKKCTIIL